MSPDDTLTHARALHRSLTPATASYWPRACALLARMALEQAVTDRLAAAHPALPEASMRAKLLCLPLVTEPGVVHDAVTAWAGLSRACHQHPYELAPTSGELATWLDAVDRVTHALTDPNHPAKDHTET